MSALVRKLVREAHAALVSIRIEADPERLWGEARKLVDASLQRAEAEAKVNAFVTYEWPYKAVTHADARFLLKDKFDLLLADPIRKHGPTKDTVYPWNVVDYLQRQ